MQHENKVILSAILVLGVAMLSFSFLNFTGNTVNCVESSAVAHPSIINSGEIVTVEVKGGEGFYEEVRVFRRSLDRNGNIVDNRISFTAKDACGGKYKCDDASFKIQTLPGDQSKIWVDGQDYVVKLKDVCTQEFTIETEFRIR